MRQNYTIAHQGEVVGLTDRLIAFQAEVESQLHAMRRKIHHSPEGQDHVASTAKSSVSALQETMTEIQQNQQIRQAELIRHEATGKQSIRNNNNSELAKKTERLEWLVKEQVAVTRTQKERYQNVQFQTGMLNRAHHARQDEIGAREQVNWQIRQDLIRLRKENRIRTEPRENPTPMVDSPILGRRSPIPDRRGGSSASGLPRPSAKDSRSAAPPRQGATAHSGASSRIDPTVYMGEGATGILFGRPTIGSVQSGTTNPM